MRGPAGLSWIELLCLYHWFFHYGIRVELCKIQSLCVVQNKQAKGRRQILKLFFRISDAFRAEWVFFLANLIMQIVAWCHHCFHSWIVIIRLYTVCWEGLLFRLITPVYTEKAAFIIFFDAFQGLSRWLAYWVQLSIVFFGASMMWYNSLFFDPVYLSITPDEPSYISRVIFEFFVTKTFKGESCSKIDVSEHNWVLIGPFLRFDVRCNTWVGPCF